MSSLFAQYISERQGYSILESERGFLSYAIHDTPIGRQLFVYDMFVPQEFRSTGEARKLVKRALEIAADFECTHAMTTVDVFSKTATEAMKFQISVGMKLYKTEGSLIYLFMDLTKDQK